MSNKPGLRSYQASDSALVREMLLSAQSDPDSGFGWLGKTDEEIDSYLRSDPFGWVAPQSGDPVAFLGLVEARGGQDRWFLGPFGSGSAADELIHAGLKSCRGISGWAKVAFDARNTRALAQYETAGFRQSGRELTMARQLHESLPAAPVEGVERVRGGFPDIASIHPEGVYFTLDDLRRSFERGAGLLWVHVDGDGGTIDGYVYAEHLNGDETEVCFVNVDRSRRGRGIGGALLGQALIDIKATGRTRVQLSVRPDNDARRLYGRLGFRAVGDIRSFRKDVA